MDYYAKYIKYKNKYILEKKRLLMKGGSLREMSVIYPKFRKGDKVINVDLNKTGTINYLRDDDTEKKFRREDPTHYYYSVDYDDNSTNTYVNQDALKRLLKTKINPVLAGPEESKARPATPPLLPLARLATPRPQTPPRPLPIRPVPAGLRPAGPVAPPSRPLPRRPVPTGPGPATPPATPPARPAVAPGTPVNYTKKLSLQEQLESLKQIKDSLTQMMRELNMRIPLWNILGGGINDDIKKLKEEISNIISLFIKKYKKLPASMKYQVRHIMKTFNNIIIKNM